jgi:hypothetical protein
VAYQVAKALLRNRRALFDKDSCVLIAHRDPARMRNTSPRTKLVHLAANGTALGKILGALRGPQ